MFGHLPLHGTHVLGAHIGAAIAAAAGIGAPAAGVDPREVPDL